MLDTEIISITKDIVIQNDFIVKPHQKLVISPGVNIKLDNAYIKILGGFDAIEPLIAQSIFMELMI